MTACMFTHERQVHSPPPPSEIRHNNFCCFCWVTFKAVIYICQDYPVNLQISVDSNLACFCFTPFYQYDWFKHKCIDIETDTDMDNDIDIDKDIDIYRRHRQHKRTKTKRRHHHRYRRRHRYRHSCR